MIVLMFSFPGAAVIPEYTSPSYRSSAYKIVLFSLLSLDYVRSPELILEVGAPRNRKTKGGFGGVCGGVGECNHAAESCLYPSLCSSKLSFPVTFLYGLTHCLPAEYFLSQTASGPPSELLAGSLGPAAFVFLVPVQTVSMAEGLHCWRAPLCVGKLSWH